jgi:SEC-C motif-containing protein
MPILDCPCGSGKLHAECCEPYISRRKQAPTAEALMRARYSAYATKHIAFLEWSLHPRARKGHDPQSTRQWAEESEWLGLEVIRTEGGGEADASGTVEFKAHYRTRGEAVEHHEVAEFRREDGKWYFLDGKVIGPPPVKREAPKVGRNDPCPCGSGKKYKKCCGK